MTFVSVTSFAQNVTGTVVDSTSQKGIPFAFVQFTDVDIIVMTDQHGHYEILDNLPLPVKMKASALGYESAFKILTADDLKKEVAILLASGHNEFELDEIKISASTGVQQRFNMSNVSVKSMDELTVPPATNLVQALSNIGSVYNNSTGTGIGKPVIRGLGGNRVVASLNGLRIENQQFGGDHNLGISVLGIDNVEIVKGPSSLIYGADALGGVIHLVDEKYTSPGNVEGKFRTTFESNSLTTRNLAGLKFTKEQLRVNLHAMYTDVADYQMPSGEYAMNSRWKELALKTALGYNTKKWLINFRYNYNRSFVGIPGHTHDSIVDPNDFRVRQQDRHWILPVQQINSHFAQIENVLFLDKGDLRLFTGLTSNHLVELEDRVTIPGIDNLLNVYSYHLRYRRKINAKQQWISGYQGAHQFNSNDEKADSKLIPDATLMDQGLYTLWNFNNKSFEAQAGGRLDFRGIQTVNRNYAYRAANASAGMVKRFEPITLRLNFSTGYRPPNLNELTANGVHHGTFRYELGEANLQPEFAQQIDFSFEFEGEHLSIVANPFYNQINNFIYITPSDTAIEGYEVFEYTQSGRVMLTGGDLGFHYHPHFLHQLHLESTLSYLYTEDELKNPLPLIPQTRINSTIRLQFKNKGFVQFENIFAQHQYFFAQNRTALNETASPHYQLVNLGAQLKLQLEQPLTVSFGVQNAFNENYIDHLSRLKSIVLQNPGRNFYLKLQWLFNKSKNLHEHEK